MHLTSADTVDPPSGTSTSPSTTSVSGPPPSQPDITKHQQVEILLDYVRANRENIRRTWGPSSPQSQAADEIMQKYFNESIKKLNIDVQGASLEELIAKLSLHEKK